MTEVKFDMVMVNDLVLVFAFIRYGRLGMIRVSLLILIFSNSGCCSLEKLYVLNLIG